MRFSLWFLAGIGLANDPVDSDRSQEVRMDGDLAQLQCFNDALNGEVVLADSEPGLDRRPRRVPDIDVTADTLWFRISVKPRLHNLERVSISLVDQDGIVRYQARKLVTSEVEYSGFMFAGAWQGALLSTTSMNAVDIQGSIPVRGTVLHRAPKPGRWEARVEVAGLPQVLTAEFDVTANP